MIFLELFWSFVKIGYTSFGGLSMIALIRSEMLTHGWMTEQEVSDIVAIAEMTPGPLALNCATFVGVRMAGVAGAVLSNLGVLMPSLTIALAAAVFFEKFRQSRLLDQALVGIRSSCVGIIASVIVSLSLSNYAPSHIVDPKSIVIGLISLYLLKRKDLSIPKVIGISALLGLLLY